MKIVKIRREDTSYTFVNLIAILFEYVLLKRLQVQHLFINNLGIYIVYSKIKSTLDDIKIIDLIEPLLSVPISSETNNPTFALPSEGFRKYRMLSKSKTSE
uniref:Uncharacterized protein n=1 Tax=Romanomermis culicivorax TaxID=13658 RepID=A0A915KQU9_ROMCU